MTDQERLNAIQDEMVAIEPQLNTLKKRWASLNAERDGLRYKIAEAEKAELRAAWFEQIATKYEAIVRGDWAGPYRRTAYGYGIGPTGEIIELGDCVENVVQRVTDGGRVAMEQAGWHVRIYGGRLWHLPTCIKVWGISEAMSGEPTDGKVAKCCR